MPTGDGEGRFAGKVAVVTGGASGIGRSAVEHLCAGGASVVVADVDADAGAATVEVVAAAGGDARFVAADVTDVSAVEAMVAAAVDTWGRLDIAFNNAGTSGSYAPVADAAPDAWDRTLALNLTGVFLCLRAEIPAMVASGGGAIVNTSSAAGQMGFAGLSAYVASKHGVIGLTKSAALENARTGVRINAVLPGTVRTPMLEGFAGSDDALEAMGRTSPMGRLGEPAEIASAVLWLCSDEASYVTGHAFAVDGGSLAT